MAYGPESRDDDLFQYYFSHPVELLRSWLYQFIDLVCKPRFLDPPSHGVSLTEEEDTARYGPIESTDDAKPWAERRAMALNACEHALAATVDVNRWLRYGLGERAGRLETEFRTVLPELEAILRVATDPDQFKCHRQEFETNMSTLYELDRELGTAAINPDDGALDEWFKIIEAMRSLLAEFLRCHKLLYQIVFRKPRGRVGDLHYRYMMAIADFEKLLPVVETQIRRGSDEDYERIVRVLLMSAQARWSFEEVLTSNKLPPGTYPKNIHETLRRETTRIRRQLELTLAERPKADQPRVMWELGVAHSPAQRPVWDPDRRELRFGDAVCKRFKTRAANQELVLQVFQEEGWSPRIDDPLRPGKRGDTIRQLNKGNAVIRFRADGRGDGICWELIRPPK